MLSSSSLFLIPFMLTCSIMRFLSILLLGLCACVVCVVVSSAVDVLWMSVVRGMRGVGGVCEMCLVRGGVGGEGVSG